MFTRIGLPHGRNLWVCVICGQTAEDLQQLDDCGETPQLPFLERPAVQLLQEVEVFVPQHNGSLIKEPYTVSEIYYSEPGESIGFGWAVKRNLHTHTLCLRLRQSWDKNMKLRAWKPTDNAYSAAEMTHEDFLLYQEGDRAKMETAGLVKPLPKSLLAKAAAGLNNWFANFAESFTERC